MKLILFFFNANGNLIMKVAITEKGHLGDVLPHSGLMDRNRNLFELLSHCFLSLYLLIIIQFRG